MFHSVQFGWFWTSVFLWQKVTIISSRSSGRIGSAHRISHPGRWYEWLCQSEPGAIEVTFALSSQSSCASFGSCLLSWTIIFLIPSKNAWCGVTRDASNLASDKTGCRIAALIPIRMHDGGTCVVDLSSLRTLPAAVWGFFFLVCFFFPACLRALYWWCSVFSDACASQVWLGVWCT